MCEIHKVRTFNEKRHLGETFSVTGLMPVGFAPNHLWTHVEVAQTVLLEYETEVHMAFLLQYLQYIAVAGDIVSGYLL